MPKYFTAERVEVITDVFDTLNSEGKLALDLSEISIFFHYSIDKLFGVIQSDRNIYILMD
jgi:hypothetical protein